MINICPNCKKETYSQQPQSVDLTETLKQWEVETATRFQPQTWKEYEGKVSNLYSCSHCKYAAFVLPNPGTPNFYNDITVDSDYYIHEKWEFKKTFKLIKNKNIKSVLDFGCGGGAFLKTVSKKFPDAALTGFDENPQVEIAFDGMEIDFLNDLEKSQEKKYNMITAFQILEHVENPFVTLGKLKKALNDNGTLVVSVPNTSGPIRHYADALTEIPPHHVNRFCYSSLKVFLENEDLKIEHVAYEPLSKELWNFYLPVMVEKVLNQKVLKFYKALKGPKFLNAFIKILNISGLKTIPVKGHSIYIVAKKCAA